MLALYLISKESIHELTHFQIFKLFRRLLRLEFLFDLLNIHSFGYWLEILKFQRGPSPC